MGGGARTADDCHQRCAAITFTATTHKHTSPSAHAHAFCLRFFDDSVSVALTDVVTFTHACTRAMPNAVSLDRHHVSAQHSSDELLKASKNVSPSPHARSQQHMRRSSHTARLTHAHALAAANPLRMFLYFTFATMREWTVAHHAACPPAPPCPMTCCLRAKTIEHACVRPVS